MNNLLRKATPISFLLSIFFLGACELRIDGDLTAHQELKLYKKKLFGGYKEVPIPVGSYTANVDFNSASDKVKLTIDLDSRNSETFPFSTGNTQIPTDGTWVKIPASEHEQDYDVLLSVLKTVDVEDTIYREWERCSYERCYTRCSGSGRDRECWQECYTEYGHQIVEYRYVHTYWDTEFKLSKNENTPDAEFTGNKHIIEKDYLYEGVCR